MSNSAHPYNGMKNSRGQRLKSKLGRAISVKRLERLLRPTEGKEVSAMSQDDPKPDPAPDDQQQEG